MWGKGGVCFFVGRRNIVDIKIIIATIKPCKIPNDKIYLPIHVGKLGKKGFGYIGDDSGDNISIKNPNYCELTGIYWAWKNLKADYIGMVQYRRYFVLNKRSRSYENILKKEDVENYLKKSSILLPKKRKYYIETIYSHYSHTLHSVDLDITRDVIAKNYSDYLEAFDKVMNRKKAHINNMFIMRYDLFEEYCNWIFSVLFDVEKKLDISLYSKYEARVFGRISEYLLDVWIEKRNLEYYELNYKDMAKIKWHKKIWSFLMAKFFGVKYKESF